MQREHCETGHRILQLPTTLTHSLTIDSYETNSSRGRRRFALRDATGTGELFLEVLERLPRRGKFVVAHLCYRRDHRRANRGVEYRGERADDSPRGLSS